LEKIELRKEVNELEQQLTTAFEQNAAQAMELYYKDEQLAAAQKQIAAQAAEIQLLKNKPSQPSSSSSISTPTSTTAFLPPVQSSTSITAVSSVPSRGLFVFLILSFSFFP